LNQITILRLQSVENLTIRKFEKSDIAAVDELLRALQTDTNMAIDIDGDGNLK